MNQVQSSITDSQLGERICELKNQQAYQELVDYLIGQISAGGMPSDLQAKAYNELGLAHLQLDEPMEAEKAFLSAIERSPKSINPKFNRANIALFAQQYALALELYREILTVDAGHAGATYHAGLCCAMTGQQQEALTYFETSATAAPEAMGPNFWSGETLLAMKQYESALPYFLQAVSITPDHRESRRGVAICQFELGKYDDCITQCDELIESGGGAEYLAFQIKGDALIEQGNIEAAAMCHLELAYLDFDARDYLVMRSRKLEKQHPECVEEYVAFLLSGMPDLERAFDGSAFECQSEQQQ
ncbi:tetratricopeptide repeat protein [Halodesulfovibrio marinisediminis]|uniref:Tfp pilus assembly protein PilF n=1 Tax=Halodesulfovibrio marinisediminis DSM 17456 TaxID=1121457 RepID=A0A1N6E9M4_9BACT|nr:tetratricopeptide repeat protein [Halodesulfovibrio marinisediminis]SIN79749.1 Tfp pilus assembly protein PilF [Halodesulfovibrio marinisediminis DSM 17456]